MPDIRQKLIHLHSSSVKVPTAAQLEYGEIAVQYDATAPVLYIKNSSGQIVKFIDEVAVKALLTNVYTYKGSKSTYEELPESGNVTGDVWNVVSAHGNVPAGTNYAWDGSQWDSLGGSVDLSNYITNETFTAHTSNKDVHVSSAEKNVWNNKQEAFENASVLKEITAQQVSNWDTAVTSLSGHIDDDTIHVTTVQTGKWDDAVSDINTHISNGTIHVTTDDKEEWSGKQDAFSNSGTLATITDTKVTNWDNAATNSHTHSNKALLDTYLQSESDLADAVSKKHNHANSAALETITTEKIADWDEAAASAHTHDNKSVLDGIDSTKVTNWDSAYNTVTAHTADTDIHVTAQDKTTWSGKQDAIEDLTDIRNNATSGKNAYDTVVANKDNWDAAYAVSQNALVGIESGKESGAAVNASRKLDFSGLCIDCGEY